MLSVRSVNVSINAGFHNPIGSKRFKIVKDTKTFTKRLQDAIDEVVSIHNGPVIRSLRVSPFFYTVTTDKLRWINTNYSADILIQKLSRDSATTARLEVCAYGPATVATCSHSRQQVYLIEEKRAEMVLAVIMGLHRRLGADSPINILGPDTVRSVLVHFVTGFGL